MFGGLFKKHSLQAKETSSIGKIALMIVAPQNFRDEECFETKDELEKAGVKVVVASLTKGEKTGKAGGKILAEKGIGEINTYDYDAVLFIGGSGAEMYFKNPIALDIARQAYRKEKLIAAICIAPIILATAGILSGKKVTAFDCPESRAAISKADATFTGRNVEADGKVITGNGPKASREFGRKIAELI